MFMRLKNNRGFSMLEMVLALVMGALIVGATSQSLLDNVDSYTFIANRKSALGDARFAMNRMTQDFLKLNSNDSELNIAPGGTAAIGLTFKASYDEDCDQCGYYMAANGSGGNALWRGNGTDADQPDQILVDNISAFTLTYRDENNVITADPTLVRRITIVLSTAEVSNEGSVTLQTTVAPRSYIGYANYQ